jgi:hypothetical protein
MNVYTAFNPVRPAELSITVGGITVAVIGDRESLIDVGQGFVSPGSGYSPSNWFVQTLYSSNNATVALFYIHNSLGSAGTQYIGNIDDLSTVLFIEDPIQTSLTTLWILGVDGTQNSQLVYQLESITVGPYAAVPEPASLALLATGLVGIVLLRRQIWKKMAAS